MTLVSACSILSVGSTYAYLKIDADPVKNSFSASPSITPSIQNGKINVGQTEYSVYVRALVNVAWKNGNDVYYKAPAETQDYALAINQGWKRQDDGFYLYTSAVGSEESIDLPVSVSSAGSTPPAAGYSVSVDFCVQTIQAEGIDQDGKPVIESAWGYQKP